MAGEMSRAFCALATLMVALGAAVQRAGRDSRIIVVIVVLAYLVVVPVVVVVTSGSRSSRASLEMKPWRSEITIEICNQFITDEAPSWINNKHSS